MTTLYLEHANITVNNLDRAIHFFKTAFPNFRVRGGGESKGSKWVHLGTDDTYLALSQSLVKIELDGECGALGINHIGFVVSEVDALAVRLLEAGYKRDYPKENEEFRVRDYFADDDGNQFEFVEYLSNKTEEKNKY